MRFTLFVYVSLALAGMMANAAPIAQDPTLDARKSSLKHHIAKPAPAPLRLRPSPVLAKPAPKPTLAPANPLPALAKPQPAHVKATKVLPAAVKTVAPAIVRPAPVKVQPPCAGNSICENSASAGGKA
ncbi:hypothetical protein EVG20_g8651 [Dentipellis fragilis]|uniref:Uncharacterized protein n=1 Tax=Dentipellis fragilis TaxID=205917 RepID=A0A4Y9Y6D3_9AGAM|nr:hypothetical protein EVG20_g8651 [Dentipellis fragilis]